MYGHIRHLRVRLSVTAAAAACIALWSLVAPYLFCVRAAEEPSHWLCSQVELPTDYLACMGERRGFVARACIESGGS